MEIQLLVVYQLKTTLIGEAIAKKVILDKIWTKFGLNLDLLWSKFCTKYLNLNKYSKFLVYTIEIHVLAVFQLKTRNNLHKTDFF